MCRKPIPDDGWAQTTSFRYPWLGYLIDKRYRLVQYLGYGGMGDVYRAESLSVGVSFAAKVIDRRVVPSIKTIEDLAQRLDREVAAMAMLSSPHVTRVIDYFVMPEEIFILLIEFAPGRTLDKIVVDHGPVTAPVAVEMTRQVLEALAELDRLELVHRDLKPENLMVQVMPSGRPFVRLLDFGIVKTLEHTRITEGFLGTPHFAAPEQALDAASVDGRSDLYSVGCILYYLLSGEVPFPADSSVAVLNAHLHSPVPVLRDEFPGIDPALSDLVVRLMAKESLDRPQSAEALLALDLFHAGVGRFDDLWSVSDEEVEPEPEEAPRTPRQRRLPAGQLAQPHTTAVALSAVSPNGLMAAVITGSYELITWRTDGAGPSNSRRLPASRVARWLFFSASGDTLFTVTNDGHVSLLDADTLDDLAELALLPSNYRWVGPSRVNEKMILAATPGSLCRWHVDAGLCNLVEGQFFSDIGLARPLGRHHTVLLEVPSGRRIQVREAKDDAGVCEVGFLKTHSVVAMGRALDLAPFGQMIVALGERLVEANHHHDRSAPLQTEPGDEWMAAVVLSDGNPYCLNANGQLVVFAVGQEPRVLSSQMSALGAGTDRGRLVAFGIDGRAESWTVDAVAPSYTIQFTERPVDSGLLWDVSPELNQALVAKSNQATSRINVLRLAEGVAISERVVDLPTPIGALRWSDDGGSAFATTIHHEPFLIDLETGTSVMVSTSIVEAVAGCVGSGGRMVCLADQDGLIESINSSNGELLWRVQSSAPVTALASAQARNIVAYGRLDGTVVLVNATTGADERELAHEPGAAPAEQVRFSHDGQFLVVKSSTGRTDVYDTESLALASRVELADPSGRLVGVTASGTPMVFRLSDGTLERSDPRLQGDAEQFSLPLT